MEITEVIPSTMDESLLFSHFEMIADLCRQYGMSMNLTTNGTFPRLGAIAWAEKIVPITGDVKISWNRATNEIYPNLKNYFSCHFSLYCGDKIRETVSRIGNSMPHGRFFCSCPL